MTSILLLTAISVSESSPYPFCELYITGQVLIISLGVFLAAQLGWLAKIKPIVALFQKARFVYPLLLLSY